MSSATSARLWTETTDTSRGISQPLMAALSREGKERLWQQLQQAIEASPGDPEQALQVVEAWWRTMLIRRHPDFERRMTDPGPGRTDQER
jgi:hypothetical protein